MVVDAAFWQTLSDRLLPLGADDRAAMIPDPENLAALEAFWGGKRALRPAAVLVGLIPRGDELRVLLTRRTETLVKHAGQVSFPGGRIDPGDGDAVTAALRETREEVGLASGLVQPIGRLPAFATISEYTVEPVIARIDPDHALTLEAGEVSAAFELPLSLAADEQAWQPYRPPGAAPKLAFRALEYQGYTVWGVTAMILEQLLARMKGMLS